MKPLKPTKITKTIFITPVPIVCPGEYITVFLSGEGDERMPVELSVDDDGNPLILVREKDLKYVSTYEKQV